MSDLLFYLHIGSLCVAGVGILLADSEAFSWLRGKQEVIIGMQSRVAHWTVTLGLAGLTLSGLALFWPMRDYLIGDPLFWIKMALVFALLINGIVI